MPAPILSRTPAVPSSSPDPMVGEHTAEVMSEIGYSVGDIDKLLEKKVIFQHDKTSPKL